MTRKDMQIFYTALGYVLAHLTSDSPEKAEPGVIYAAHIEDYCRRNIENAFPVNEIRFVNDVGVDAIDQAIDNHIKQLRAAEMTILPQDKETLLKFYDRLQQRRSRRAQAAFYERVHVEMLANRVLNYLDEEIREMEAVA